MKVALTIVLLASGIVHGQPPQPLVFDMASVTRNVTNKEGESVLFPSTIGIFSIRNATTELIVKLAYQIEDSPTQLARADSPSFDWGARFDIRFPPRNGRSAEQHYEMLRRLLADRFKLRVHTETRQLPAYALTVVGEGRLGPQLQRTSVYCEPFHSLTRLRALLEGAGDSHLICATPRDESSSGAFLLQSSGALTKLADSLTGLIDRPVLDETRLGGTFEWKLSFGRTQVATNGAISWNVADVAEMDAALREQLGLRLAQKTWPVEFLVIDSIEMPSQN